MNKKILYSIVTVCLILTTEFVASASAGWMVDTSVPFDSNNKYSSDNNNSINLRDGRYQSDLESNSHNDYSTYIDRRDLSDNRQDKSVTDSFNIFDSSDNSDHSVDNSVNMDYSNHEVVSGTKRVNSNDISVSGDVRNSNLGNFNQVYAGTDLSSGIGGSNNTIDARAINVTTFGDTIGPQQ